MSRFSTTRLLMSDVCYIQCIFCFVFFLLFLIYILFVLFYTRFQSYFI